MFRYLLSWRYLVRRRTNLIAIVGLFLAVGALIMILSIMTGFLEESRRIVRGSLSDVVVSPVFIQRRDGTHVLQDPAPALAVLRADPRIAACAARLSYYGILNRPGFVGTGGQGEGPGGILARTGSATLAGVQLVGIDVDDELATTELYRALARDPLHGVRVENPGRPFQRPADLPPDAPPPAVVGEQLFTALGLARGDVIEVLTARPDAERGGVEERTGRFTVAGTFRFGQNETDLSRIYVARDTLREVIAGDRAYSEICAKLVDYDRDAPSVCDDLSDELERRALINGADELLEVRTWESFRGSLMGSIENQRSIMAILLSLVLLVAGFTVFAILSMMVNEKRRDVGILAALGATPRGVVSLFLMIAVWDVVLGASAGAAAGTWAAIEIDAIERWLSSVIGFQIIDRDLYLFDTLPSRVEPGAVLAIVGGTLVATLAAALVPAWRASRLDPLQAVRQD